MPDKNLLEERSNEFDRVVSNCIFSDQEGNKFGAEPGIQNTLNVLQSAKERKASVYVVGNGGSAAVASHILTDFINVAGLRASVLHDPSLLTCMTNDYGYENAFSNVLKKIGSTNDVLIAISSSGNSMNIRNAASCMKEIGGEVITLTGFAEDNFLRQMGDLNIWLNSSRYGLVEIGHLFLLHHLSDRLA
tara:strand:+ start:123 stop:692 length:570 start_codon:yes stop_codon:yes gene_type:complete